MMFILFFAIVVPFLKKIYNMIMTVILHALAALIPLLLFILAIKYFCKFLWWVMKIIRKIHKKFCCWFDKWALYNPFWSSPFDLFLSEKKREEKYRVKEARYFQMKRNKENRKAQLKESRLALMNSIPDGYTRLTTS